MTYSRLATVVAVGSAAVVGSILSVIPLPAAAAAATCNLGMPPVASAALFQPVLDPAATGIVQPPNSRVFLHSGVDTIRINVTSPNIAPKAFAVDARGGRNDVPVTSLDPARNMFQIAWRLEDGGPIVQRLFVSDGQPATKNGVTLFAISGGGLLPGDAFDGSGDANQLRGAAVSFVLPGGLGCLRLANLDAAGTQGRAVSFTPTTDPTSAFAPSAARITLQGGGSSFVLPFTVRLPATNSTVAGSLTVGARSISSSALSLANPVPLALGPVSLSPNTVGLTFGSGATPNGGGLVVDGTVKLDAAFASASLTGKVALAFVQNGLKCTSLDLADGNEVLQIRDDGALPAIIVTVNAGHVDCGTSDFAFDGSVSLGAAPGTRLPFKARYDHGLHLSAPDGTPLEAFAPAVEHRAVRRPVRRSLGPHAQCRARQQQASLDDDDRAGIEQCPRARVGTRGFVRIRGHERNRRRVAARTVPGPHWAAGGKGDLRGKPGSRNADEYGDRAGLQHRSDERCLVRRRARRSGRYRHLPTVRREASGDAVTVLRDRARLRDESGEARHAARGRECHLSHDTVRRDDDHVGGERRPDDHLGSTAQSVRHLDADARRTWRSAWTPPRSTRNRSALRSSSNSVPRSRSLRFSATRLPYL